ncbi:glutathione S-transferase family protein, partial [Actinomadura adrarensis]
MSLYDKRLVLYDNELDPDCYAARLMLAFLDLPYEKVLIDNFPGNEKPPGHGGLPVLRDGDRYVGGTIPVLEHLAVSFGPTWTPRNRNWLKFADIGLWCAREAREQALFGADDRPDPKVVDAAARRLELMDDHLTELEHDGRRWFDGKAPSIADVALFAPA